MRKAVERNLIQAPKIGKNNVTLSHLQYADDTIFIVNGDPDNAKALRWLLKNFEMLSGLSVNFEKCSAYGVNLDREELHSLATDFGCRVGSFPIPYLGLKVGGNSRNYEGWNDIIKKLTRKISKWDGTNLSLAGRSTIVQSVLTSTTTYALSFMPLPKNLNLVITRLFRDFLWGSHGITKKIAWIKWDDLTLSKSEGGLGFINLQSFNAALLCKWVWRFLSNEDSLWKRIIISRHGDLPWSTSGSLPSRLRKPRVGWWRKIINLVDGDKGSWFWNLLRRQLGDGKNTQFWEGAWLGPSTLKSQYPRLFHLSANQHGMVSDMGTWEDGEWKWLISWRRDLRSSELALASSLLDQLTVGPSSPLQADSWEWFSKPSSISLVRFLYSNLEKSRRAPGNPLVSNEAFKRIWKSVAPLKAQTTGWRLCRNRLPTLDNLQARINLDASVNTCCFCQEKEESSKHLFFECVKVRIVWDNFLLWIGCSWAPPLMPCDHLISFAFLQEDKFSKILSGLWLCIIWVWWKWRNDIIFEHKDWNINRIVTEIKCRFWSWCVVRGHADSRITYEAWGRTPSFIL